jgi:hypothetical protein
MVRLGFTMGRIVEPGMMVISLDFDLRVATQLPVFPTISKPKSIEIP